MKLLVFFSVLLLLCCNVSFGQIGLTKIDTNKYISSGTSRLVVIGGSSFDRLKNKTIDSSTWDTSGNEYYYIHNYKKVPLGYYSDTAFMEETCRLDGHKTSYIQFYVFYDRQVLMYCSFIMPKSWVWNAYINKELLKSINK